MNGTGSIIVMEKKGGDALPLLGGSTSTIEEMERREKEGIVEERPTKKKKTKVNQTNQASQATEAVSKEEPWHVKFGEDRLRYFTPNEILKLLGFPTNFFFPSSVPLKKRYALLGNSLHVGTVARLLHILLSDDTF
jgi:site-specific DNA-cytosine methylase